jgi:hypothetical protein
MKRRTVHIVTPCGIEGWVPDPHRWDGACVIAVVIGILVIGVAIGWVAALEWAVGWVLG